MNTSDLKKRGAELEAEAEASAAALEEKFLNSDKTLKAMAKSLIQLEEELATQVAAVKNNEVILNAARDARAAADKSLAEERTERKAADERARVAIEAKAKAEARIAEAESSLKAAKDSLAAERKAREKATQGAGIPESARAEDRGRIGAARASLQCVRLGRCGSRGGNRRQEFYIRTTGLRLCSNGTTHGKSGQSEMNPIFQLSLRYPSRAD